MYAAGGFGKAGEGQEGNLQPDPLSRTGMRTGVLPLGAGFEGATRVHRQ